MSKLTDNQKERFATIGSLMIECFKIFMSSLLLVFVPQYCEDTQTTCTFHQNFTDLNNPNKGVLALNFFTLATIIYYYYTEISRQFYFIKHLDCDDNYPDNHLHTILPKYPAEKEVITKLNTSFLKCIQWTLFVFIVNAALSAWVIYYYYYDGFRSVTGLLTNCLLVANKFYSDWGVVKQSTSGDCVALSTFLNEPLSYNCMDKKRYPKEEIELVE
jgi:hypothetical protein